MITFLLGLCFGAAQIGAQTWRIVWTLVGQRVKVLFASIVLAVVYWFSVDLVVQRDLVGYLGFSIGAATVSVLIAHSNAVKAKLIDKEE